MPKRSYLAIMGLNIENLRSGDAGTWQTVQVIRRFVAEGRVDPLIRKQAIAVVGSGGRQPEREVSALLNFVRRRIRYVADPVDTEFVASARRVLEIGGGDCDDLVVLLGALLESIGYETQVKVMAVDRRAEYEHVYLLVKIAGAWLPLDPTSRTQGLGWEYPLRGREHTFSIPRPQLGELEWKWLDDLGRWIGKQAKAVVRFTGQVASALGPVLAVIPGVGTVTAAIVTVAGKTVVKLTDPKTGRVIGYAPGNTVVDANGNLVLDSATLAQLNLGQASAGGSNWWLYLALGGVAALLLGGGRKR